MPQSPIVVVLLMDNQTNILKLIDWPNNYSSTLYCNGINPYSSLSHKFLTTALQSNFFANIITFYCLPITSKRTEAPALLNKILPQKKKNDNDASVADKIGPYLKTER